MTLELIAEQLWHAGWLSVVECNGPGKYVARLLYRHAPLAKNHIGRGDSAVVALERARAELDKEQQT